MNIIFLVLLLAIVMVGEFVMEGMHLPTWPAFIVMIFFFMAHMNMKEVTGPETFENYKMY